MSTLYVNNIAPKTGNTINITGAFNGGGGSNVKEVLAMACDGGSYTVSSGTYTSQNVTAGYDVTSTYVDVTGSTINYVPPSGSTCVIYDFNFQFGHIDAHGIGNFEFFIDGVQPTYLRRSISAGNYLEGSFNLRHVIPIGGTTSTDTGRQSSWTSAKELKLKARAYGTGNRIKIHLTNYWEGANQHLFCQPNLIITALG